MIKTYWNSFVTPYVLKMTIVHCLFSREYGMLDFAGENDESSHQNQVPKMILQNILNTLMSMNFIQSCFDVTLRI